MAAGIRSRRPRGGLERRLRPLAGLGGRAGRGGDPEGDLLPRPEGNAWVSPVWQIVTARRQPRDPPPGAGRRFSAVDGKDTASPRSHRVLPANRSLKKAAPRSRAWPRAAARFGRPRDRSPPGPSFSSQEAPPRRVTEGRQGGDHREDEGLRFPQMSSGESSGIPWASCAQQSAIADSFRRSSIGALVLHRVHGRRSQSAPCAIRSTAHRLLPRVHALHAGHRAAHSGHHGFVERHEAVERRFQIGDLLVALRLLRVVDGRADFRSGRGVLFHHRLVVAHALLAVLPAGIVHRQRHGLFSWGPRAAAVTPAGENHRLESKHWFVLLPPQIWRVHRKAQMVKWISLGLRANASFDNGFRGSRRGTGRVRERASIRSAE